MQQNRITSWKRIPWRRGSSGNTNHPRNQEPETEGKLSQDSGSRHPLSPDMICLPSGKSVKLVTRVKDHQVAIVT